MTVQKSKAKAKAKAKSPKARASRAKGITPNRAAGAFTLFGAALGAGAALLFS